MIKTPQLYQISGIQNQTWLKYHLGIVPINTSLIYSKYDLKI